MYLPALHVLMGGFVKKILVDGRSAKRASHSLIVCRICYQDAVRRRRCTKWWNLNIGILRSYKRWVGRQQNEIMGISVVTGIQT